MNQVDIVWYEFWEPIIGDDWEQAKKELYDYRVVMKNASEVYYELTGGKFSKPNTAADVIISEVNEREQRAIAEEAARLKAQVAELQGAAQELLAARQLRGKEYWAIRGKADDGHVLNAEGIAVGRLQRALSSDGSKLQKKIDALVAGCSRANAIATVEMANMDGARDANFYAAFANIEKHTSDAVAAYRGEE